MLKGRSISIVTPSFEPGGAERVAVNLADHYSGEGMKVKLIAFKGIGPYLSQVPEGVEIIDLGLSSSRWGFFKLLRTLREHRTDLLISVLRKTNTLVGLTSYFFDIPTMIFCEATTLDAVNRSSFLSRSFYRNLMRVTYRQADRVITGSTDTKDHLLQYRIVDGKKIAVLGNPVLPDNVDIMSLEEIVHPWLSDRAFRTILSVGRLHWLKNHRMLISAFAEVREKMDNARLIILGEGKEKKWLMEFARSKKIEDSIDFPGFQDNPYPFYKNADVFVLTSNWEGFGNVLVEAMACKVPVISTNCPGGPREILQGGRYGTLVEMDDVSGLRDAILRVFTQPDQQQVEDARNRAMEYTIENIAQNYIRGIAPR